jgi:hypothetical protein
VRAASGGSLSPLGWACMDAGRWDDALKAAAEVDDFSTGYQMDIVRPSPRGALVRRTAGSSDTPDPSQNTMAARRRRAPARILGPVLSHPTGDRPLVTLDGAAGGPLQPVVQPVAQQLPDVAAMVGDPGQPLDHGGDAVKDPVVGVEAVRAGALPQRLVDGGQLGRKACGRPDGGRRCAVPPAHLPASGRASGWRSVGRRPARGRPRLGSGRRQTIYNRTSRLPAMPGSTSLAPTWRRIR